MKNYVIPASMYNENRRMVYNSGFLPTKIYPTKQDSTNYNKYRIDGWFGITVATTTTKNDITPDFFANIPVFNIRDNYIGWSTSSTGIGRFFTCERCKDFTLTVDMPIVWETDAAGLGVLGSVTGCWAMISNDAIANKNTTVLLVENICFIQF
jgi:hypothetical protein